MRIKVRLFATLREGRGKELLLDYPEGTLVDEVINDLKIKDEDVSILLVHGRDAKRTQEINIDDVISIFPPVGGG